jgi:hypothetical protein
MVPSRPHISRQPCTKYNNAFARWHEILTYPSTKGSHVHYEASTVLLHQITYHPSSKLMTSGHSLARSAGIPLCGEITDDGLVHNNSEGSCTLKTHACMHFMHSTHKRCTFIFFLSQLSFSEAFWCITFQFSCFLLYRCVHLVAAFMFLAYCKCTHLCDSTARRGCKRQCIQPQPLCLRA